MHKNWKTYTVEELIASKIIYKPLDGNHGGTHPKGSDFISSGIPFVMASDINNGKVELKKCKFISKQQADKLRKGFAIEGDVLLTHKASIGRTAIVPKIDSDYIMLTPQVTYYRIKDDKLLSNRYLMHFFNSPFFQNEIGMRAGSGSTRAYIGITDQQRLSVVLPPLPEQTQIANILSAIDDKIENNLATNKTLEDMAMALYKHWFVDFGPFQDGEFVDSELGKIPKGWEVIRVDEIASFIDPHPSHRAPKVVEGGYPFAGIGDIDEMGNINLLKARKVGLEAIDKQSRSYEINNYSIGFGRVGTVGKVVKLRPQKFRYSISPTLAVINSKEEAFEEFIYYMVKSLGFQNQVKNNQTGSTRPTIGIQTLRALLVTIPKDKVIINKFKEKVRSYYLIGDNLNKENQTLSKLRDTLLPKLISGDVRLKEFREQLENLV